MSELTATKEEIREKMVDKLLKDPDKFERMFAARYLYKYDFIASKSALITALNEDEDKEVVRCITVLLKEKKEELGTGESE